MTMNSSVNKIIAGMQRIKFADQDGDGRLSKSEDALFDFSRDAKSLWEKMINGDFGEDTQKYQEQLKTDLDKKQTLAQEIYSNKVDANNDGLLSKSELEQLASKSKGKYNFGALTAIFGDNYTETFQIEDLLAYNSLLDKDGDGQVEDTEVSSFKSILSQDFIGANRKADVLEALQKALQGQSMTTEQQAILTQLSGSFDKNEQWNIEDGSAWKKTTSAASIIDESIKNDIQNNDYNNVTVYTAEGRQVIKATASDGRQCEWKIILDTDNRTALSYQLTQDKINESTCNRTISQISGNVTRQYEYTCTVDSSGVITQPEEATQETITELHEAAKNSGNLDYSVVQDVTHSKSTLIVTVEGTEVTIKDLPLSGQGKTITTAMLADATIKKVGENYQITVGNDIYLVNAASKQITGVTTSAKEAAKANVIANLQGIDGFDDEKISKITFTFDGDTLVSFKVGNDTYKVSTPASGVSGGSIVYYLANGNETKDNSTHTITFPIGTSEESRTEVLKEAISGGTKVTTKYASKTGNGNWVAGDTIVGTSTKEASENGKFYLVTTSSSKNGGTATTSSSIEMDGKTMNLPISTSDSELKELVKGIDWAKVTTLSVDGDNFQLVVTKDGSDYTLTINANGEITNCVYPPSREVNEKLGDLEDFKGATVNTDSDGKIKSVVDKKGNTWTVSDDGKTYTCEDLNTTITIDGNTRTKVTETGSETDETGKTTTKTTWTKSTSGWGKGTINTTTVKQTDFEDKNFNLVTTTVNGKATTVLNIVDDDGEILETLSFPLNNGKTKAKEKIEITADKIDDSSEIKINDDGTCSITINGTIYSLEKSNNAWKITKSENVAEAQNKAAKETIESILESLELEISDDDDAIEYNKDGSIKSILASDDCLWNVVYNKDGEVSKLTLETCDDEEYSRTIEISDSKLVDKTTEVEEIADGVTSTTVVTFEAELEDDKWEWSDKKVVTTTKHAISGSNETAFTVVEDEDSAKFYLDRATRIKYTLPMTYTTKDGTTYTINPEDLEEATITDNTGKQFNLTVDDNIFTIKIGTGKIIGVSSVNAGAREESQKELTGLLEGLNIVDSNTTYAFSNQNKVTSFTITTDDGNVVYQVEYDKNGAVASIFEGASGTALSESTHSITFKDGKRTEKTVIKDDDGVTTSTEKTYSKTNNAWGGVEKTTTTKTHPADTSSLKYTLTKVVEGGKTSYYMNITYDSSTVSVTIPADGLTGTNATLTFDEIMKDADISRLSDTSYQIATASAIYTISKSGNNWTITNYDTSTARNKRLEAYSKLATLIKDVAKITLPSDFTTSDIKNVKYTSDGENISSFEYDGKTYNIYNNNDEIEADTNYSFAAAKYTKGATDRTLIVIKKSDGTQERIYSQKVGDEQQTMYEEVSKYTTLTENPKTVYSIVDYTSFTSATEYKAISVSIGGQNYWIRNAESNINTSRISSITLAADKNTITIKDKDGNSYIFKNVNGTWKYIANTDNYDASTTMIGSISATATATALNSDSRVSQVKIGDVTYNVTYDLTSSAKTVTLKSTDGKTVKVYTVGTNNKLTLKWSEDDLTKRTTETAKASYSNIITLAKQAGLTLPDNLTDSTITHVQYDETTGNIKSFEYDGKTYSMWVTGYKEAPVDPDNNFWTTGLNRLYVSDNTTNERFGVWTYSDNTQQIVKNEVSKTVSGTSGIRKIETYNLTPKGSTTSKQVLRIFADSSNYLDMDTVTNININNVTDVNYNSSKGTIVVTMNTGSKITFIKNTSNNEYVEVPNSITVADLYTLMQGEKYDTGKSATKTITLDELNTAYSKATGANKNLLSLFTNGKTLTDLGQYIAGSNKSITWSELTKYLDLETSSETSTVNYSKLTQANIKELSKTQKAKYKELYNKIFGNTNALTSQSGTWYYGQLTYDDYYKLSDEAKEMLAPYVVIYDNGTVSNVKYSKKDYRVAFTSNLADLVEQFT